MTHSAAIPTIFLYLFLRSVIQEERAFLVAGIIYVFYAIISNITAKRNRMVWISLGIFAAAHIFALSLVKVTAFLWSRFDVCYSVYVHRRIRNVGYFKVV